MTDYNNLPDSVEVTYTDFVECQYCGLRFGHGETAAMQNHWRDCPADHPARVEIERLQAEVERLQAANARLVAALTGLRDLTQSFLMDDHPAAVAADKAIAESEADND